jgi:predicted small secreted protein
MKIVFALILASVLSACSTVAGVGKDISSGAEWTKEKMGKAL